MGFFCLFVLPQLLGNMRGRLQETMSKANMLVQYYLHRKSAVSLSTVDVCQPGDSEVFPTSYV